MTIQLTAPTSTCTDDLTVQPEGKDLRLVGLRTFAMSITIFNLFGHTILGFEQAWITPFVALLATYSTEIFCELAFSYSQGTTPSFLGGGLRKFVDFLLPAHIGGLAVGMLTYANEALWPVAFAAAAGIASKTLFRVRCGEGTRHFLNPSNFGISITFLLLPSVGVAPPYAFTEGVSGVWDWLVPAILICTGSMLNARATKRFPLIAAWIGGFVLQAVVRGLLFGTSVEASLGPMTGLAFILFSLYMISDPGTTPSGTRCQLVFGGSVALTYGILVSLHIVFGLFFSLTIVCALRGLTLKVRSKVEKEQVQRISVQPIPTAG